MFSVPRQINYLLRVVQSLREITDEEEIFENFISNQPKRCSLESPSLGENQQKKTHWSDHGVTYRKNKKQI
jgi:hypothetical protein